MVAIVLFQTNFGFNPGISYRNDRSLPVVQATGGQVFDLRNVGANSSSEQTVAESTTRKSKPPESLTHSNDPHSSAKPMPPPSHSDPLQRVETAPPKHPNRATATTSISPENRIKHANVSQPLSSVEKPLSSSIKEIEQSELTKHTVSEPSLKHLPSEDVAQSHLSLVLGDVSQLQQNSRQLPSEPTSNVDSTTPDIKMAPSIVTHSTSNVGVRVQMESKPAKPEELEEKVETDLHAVPPQVLGAENTSPTTGATFPPLNTGKRLKGSRKSGSKLQKSSQVPVDSAAAASAAAAVPAPVVTTQRLNWDYLERKESESSLKSTDSESTGSSASAEKSDEKEDESVTPSVSSKESAASATIVTLPAEMVLKLKPPHKLSLTKEPNTGQTVHISESSPSSSEVVGIEDEGKRDLGNLKSSKSKRKLRQQKKEEKSKRKLSRAARDRTDKNNSLMDDSSCSIEQLDEEEMAEEVHVSKLTKPGSPTKLQQSQKSRQKGSAKNMEPTDPRSYLLELIVPARSSAENADSGAEGNTPPPSKAMPLSVPSSAIKSSYGATAKPQIEDIISDPFSRNPDRSTYARKKASTKKSSDKATKMTPEECTTKDAGADIGEEKEALDGSDESVGDEGDSNTTSPDAGDEIVSSTELDHVSGKLKGYSAANPTSPHDLAASLLSKIPIKRSSNSSRCVPSRARSVEGFEYDEDDIEIMKHGNLEAPDEVEKLTRPNTLSPIKDSVLSSPSPPLLGDYKAPSSLSLDAEPFYPSSNFKSKRHSKSEHRSGSQRHDGKKSNSRNGDRKMSADSKDAELRMGRGAKSTLQHGRTPTVEGSVVPMDKTMLDRAEFYQLHREKASTPPFPYGDPQAAYKYDMLLDAQDHVGDFRKPTGRDPYYSSGVVDEAMVRERSRHDTSGLDPAYLMQKAGRLPPPVRSTNRMSAALYQQQKFQQHVSNYPQAPPGFGHEARVQQFEDDFKRQQFLWRRKLIRDLYRQERAALAAVYAREQARKSAEALSSLHNPTRIGGMYPQEPNKHALTGSHGNLWDDYLDSPPPPPQQPHLRAFDDASPTGADSEPHLLSSSYLLSNMGSPQMPSRGRTLSEVSDLGGEMLPNYQPPGLQSPTSVGPPGYQRAPGAEYSRVEQQEDHDVMRKESTLMQQLKGLAWPPEGEVSTVQSPNKGHFGFGTSHFVPCREVVLSRSEHYREGNIGGAWAVGAWRVSFGCPFLRGGGCC